MTTARDIPISVGGFLRAGPVQQRDWIRCGRRRLMAYCTAAIVLGAGVYGAAMGSWRDPLQALYTAIKLPLAILLTTLGNGLLNGMLAPLLGLNVTFRQSLVMVLMSFAVMALILGSLSPVALFVVWNTPPLTNGTSLSSLEYGVLQLTLAGFVAFAGVWGNARLVPLLRNWAGSGTAAYRVLFGWLAVNLFLGNQICWVLRPFIWDPAGPVRFIGREYLRGSFFETVFEAGRRLLFT
jgi:hypothetical protein